MGQPVFDSLPLIEIYGQDFRLLLLDDFIIMIFWEVITFLILKIPSDLHAIKCSDLLLSFFMSETQDPIP